MKKHQPILILFFLFTISSFLFGNNSMTFEKGFVEEIAPGVWKIRFGTPDKFVPSKLRIRDIQHESLSALPSGSLPFELDDISCRVTDSRCIVHVPCDEPGEEIYGFGLDAKAYRHKGLRKWLSVQSSSTGKTGAGHGPVPLYYSTKGYGVWVDTARVPFVHVARLNHKFNNNSRQEKQEDLKTSVQDLYAAQAVTGKTSVVFDIPNAKGVDVYVFAGPTIKEAVQRYNLFSGGAAMPPMWGLGLKYRTYTAADADTVLNVAETLREQKIPCDIIGLEPGWQSKAYSCSLVWSDERFPAPKSFIEQLHNMNYQINLWEHAYIHPTSPLYDADSTPKCN
ncbi:Alpha-xylosidase [Limihaloglobus sulfuriphilus]|uniref:Alpha-xylosidase n=1 Tax=Limihaloglobus sulfuriphilus TaxID=1851148 RepID=A0A1Q2MF60_9BACT|nr:TIM-barrel domain-containing protein [Limihaloglobus sulfuriphilus]AQQ71310.1 Alpha-xylosidase [Limihaloglobus sulfuriphilus]